MKKALSILAVIIGFDRLRRMSGQSLFLPFYHTVSDNDLPHIKHLYPVLTTSRFRKDLDFFLKKFRPVAIPQILGYIENRDSLAGNSLFLSFDDGFREFYDVVAPILSALGIPATCFINSDFIDNKKMFFRLKASILVERFQQKPMSPGQYKSISAICSKHHLDYHDPKSLLRVTGSNKIILDEVAYIAEVSFDEYLQKCQPYLTSDQIRALIRNGFTIGAHSASHPYFPELSVDEQLNEMKSCITFLEENFKPDHRIFSFPFTDFGVSRSFFEQMRAYTDVSFGCAGLKQDIIPWNLQRKGMEIFGRNGAEEIVASEFLFYILKRITGRHIIHRN